ncbi:GNAT family N-acetyltransferase [Vibrio brasiliensis]|jgi:RimJ/RimL family protein N-acetyltransferase|uniref:GNAT family N-acetyltransferase n=1 Tax=Vibrio brasiliensis TaxID=170652 RepID=UPI001EFE3CEA|nr:GNAT family N-acetyltransferase [Vibrio brasiliensis]MCG9753271.1 GNAT family N-acetyltransferase [Vibrio brasiliensis]MCG9782856.1 GNAT family N-acetyltransferase [Vibrio brasiliensis]
MALRPFEPSHYQVLIDWIDSDQLNYLWGGHCYRFPLTKQQLELHCGKDIVYPFMLEHNGHYAGFVELYQERADCFRICRVFIAPQFRGQGLSGLMLQLLTDYARSNFMVSQLKLAVFEHNTVARQCYQSLGFKVDRIEQGTRSYEGQDWNLVLMSKQLCEIE